MTYKFQTLLIVFVAVLFCTNLFSAEGIELTAEQMKTLQKIHQLSWSAQKICTFNDYAALFEEQSALSSDGLDLSSFREDTRKIYTTSSRNCGTLYLRLAFPKMRRKSWRSSRRTKEQLLFIQNAFFQGRES